MNAVGAPLTRVDGPAKVTGSARYAAEFHPDGLAYAATHDSTVPAGRITAIDTAAAEGAPGVLLVLTHFNADLLPYQAPAERPAVDAISGEQLQVLQDAKILFSGQPCALVVATTQARALYAASLVRVTYAPYRAAGPSSIPHSPGRPPRQPQRRAAVPRRSRAIPTPRLTPRRSGSPTYLQAREQHNAMEPHVTTAKWQGERLTLWSKTQWVGNERDEIARRFGIPSENVRVINPFVGGAFGSALRTWPHVTLAAMAARRVGRPVRLELTRRQLYTAIGFRPETRQRVALGADHDGRLTALIHEVTSQTSTYEEFAEGTLAPGATTYACPIAEHATV